MTFWWTWGTQGLILMLRWSLLYMSGTLLVLYELKAYGKNLCVVTCIHMTVYSNRGSATDTQWYTKIFKYTIINLLYFFQVTLCSTFTKLRPKQLTLSCECAFSQATHSLKHKQLFNKNLIKKKHAKHFKFWYVLFTRNWC